MQRPTTQVRIYLITHFGRFSNTLLPIVGEETGPVSGKAPAVSNETKAAVTKAADSSPIGSHVAGQDAGSKVGTQVGHGEKKVKSEKERMHTSCIMQTADSQEYELTWLACIVERERKKAEKQAKFDQKKAKIANAAPTTSKSKEKKAKADKKAEEEILPPYVEDTPVGEKKSTAVHDFNHS